MIKIAVFASGEGTNLQALLDATQSRRIKGEIALVISSNENAGALVRAKRAKVPAVVLGPKSYANADEYSAALAAECKRADIGLICMAGFMHQLKGALLSQFPNRILNIHPALLPAFGGKGMYGLRVHEAVLEAGARVSGCTIHFVDEIYDHGPIISQHPVPVFAADTPATLAARIRAQEHWGYPEAVRLFCESRLEVVGRTVRFRPSPSDASPRIRRALVSVSDKEGIIDLCKGLADLGVEIVSTSGTAKALRDAGLEVRALDTITGFPEILSGRVKTLHPKIHGGILLRRGDAEHRAEAEAFGIEPIDMVIVNLYPFARAAMTAADPFGRELIEQIDIGGVALIRAAAKNFEDVAVLVSPTDYAPVLKELETSQGRLSVDTRRRLALAGFRHTAEYDATICKTWERSQPAFSGAAAPADRIAGTMLSAAPGTHASVSVPGSPSAAPSRESAASDLGAGGAFPAEKFPPLLSLNLERAQTLRYGENPHQQAAVYRLPAENSVTDRELAGTSGFQQLQGKELSYNNLLDAAGTWDAVSDFADPAVVIFKHVTPCGIGTGETIEEAFDRAWACDPLSAFGGVMAANRPFPASIAKTLANRFMEVIVAPSFEPEALELLREKNNLRLLVRKTPPSSAPQLRSIGDLVLVTDPDRQVFGPDWKVVTQRAPSAEEERALRFAWTACKHVKSNAIVLAGTHATVGIGAGQMSRVDSVHMAGVKFKIYLKDHPLPKPLVLASDAFFPFRDGVDAAAALGISAIVQPGGSVRDAEVIAAADEHGLAMAFTGMRHFRH